MKEVNTLKSNNKSCEIISKYKEVILLFLISRILWIAVMVIAPTPFTEVFGLFDTESYRYIAANGYIDELTVFFPVIPLLIRFISDIGVIIVNNVAFFFSLVLIRHLLKDHYHMEEYNTVLGIIAVSPQSFFSTLEYTESIFFLLTVASFCLFLERKHFLLLGLILGLSVATRNSGSMLFLAIFVAMCILWAKKEIRLCNILMTYIPATVISLIYPIYLQVKFGNWKLFMDAQMEYWLRISSNIFKTVFIGFQVLFTDTYKYDGFDFTILNKTNEALSLTLFICTCILLFLEIRPMIRSRKISSDSVVLVLYTVFFLITINMTIRDPHIDCPTDSFYRYYAGLFPLYLMLRRVKKKTALQLILLCTLPVSIITSYFFSKGIFFF